jgi:hypothetical protein
MAKQQAVWIRDDLLHDAEIRGLLTEDWTRLLGEAIAGATNVFSEYVHIGEEPPWDEETTEDDRGEA